ncbi:MAG TPA: NAD(P)-dependent oxidoreductase [Stellaceae bacterium]|nr:NAD(P)-dependent oxidoreductase [Stellaceae bacterium]
MEIGWIGPGKLGLAMAAKAVQAGHKVTAFVRDPAKVPAVEAKGVGAAGFTQAAGHAVIFTCLPDDKVLVEVAGKLIPAMAQGHLLVETSTVSAEASRAVAEIAAARGVAYLRAPVSGNPIVVNAGKAAIMASGPKDGFERAKPIFDSFAVATHYLGDGEQARVVKLAMNLLIAVTCGMIGEAMALSASSGVDEKVFLDILGSTALASPFIQGKIAALKANDMTPTFQGSQMMKDLSLALAEANRAGVPAPLTALTLTQYAALAVTGELEQDLVAVAKLAGRFLPRG